VDFEKITGICSDLPLYHVNLYFYISMFQKVYFELKVAISHLLSSHWKSVVTHDPNLH
jgi:hypothetical protein